MAAYSNWSGLNPETPPSETKKNKILSSFGRLFSKLKQQHNQKERKPSRPLRRSRSDAGDLYNGLERNFNQGVRASFHMVSPYDNISPDSVFSEGGLQMAQRSKVSYQQRPPINEPPSFEIPDRPHQVRPSLENIFDIKRDSKPHAAKEAPSFEIPDRPHQIRPSLENIFDIKRDSKVSVPSKARSLPEQRPPKTRSSERPRLQSQRPSNTPSDSDESSDSSEQEPDLIIRQNKPAQNLNSRRRSTGEESIISTASTSSERSRERSHRRLTGKKLIAPLDPYRHQPLNQQTNVQPHRRQRSTTDPRYLPPPLLLVPPQAYQGMPPYSYPPIAVGYLPYYIPYADEVPVMLNAIKEEGSTQGSEASLTLTPPPNTSFAVPVNFPFPPNVRPDIPPSKHSPQAAADLSPGYMHSPDPSPNLTPTKSQQKTTNEPPAGLDEFVLY